MFIIGRRVPHPNDLRLLSLLLLLLVVVAGPRSASHLHLGV
jgi:hypothetical protein